MVTSRAKQNNILLQSNWFEKGQVRSSKERHLVLLEPLGKLKNSDGFGKGCIFLLSLFSEEKMSLSKWH
jgi:hypothetical protein